jgi:glycosyltransferase involved in cell wall biosynthesis
MVEKRGDSVDILFVITDLEVGGSEGQLALLAGELAKSGMTVAVYAFMDGPVRKRLVQADVEVIVGLAAGGTLSALSMPFAALYLFWVMLRRRPTIAHFILPAAYLTGAPLAALARVPVRVMSRRSLNTYQRNGFVRFIERLWHHTMHAVLGNSRGVVAQLSAEGIAADRLGLIYNGIEQSRFSVNGSRNEARAALGILPEALVLCIVANLIAYKGHRDLIDALALAAPFMPAGWRLLVVGRDDGIGQSLRSQVQDRSIDDHILFLGPYADIPAILGASDVGILCSHEEGFSNAILEGMAAGLPMVVTRVGGNSEAVIDGQTGLVVPAHDAQRLSAAIIKLANDPVLRANYGDAGRKRVAQAFGVDRFVESHRKLYRALVVGGRPRDVLDVQI